MLVFLNFSSVPFKKDLIKRAVNFVLKKEKVAQNRDLSVILVSQERIKELNRKYRKKNRVTNVLSFEGDKSVFNKLGLDPELGEIFICPEFVRQESQKKKSGFNEEMIMVLIHGLLHLLGYDHIKESEARKMFEKQNYYLNSFLEKY